MGLEYDQAVSNTGSTTLSTILNDLESWQRIMAQAVGGELQVFGLRDAAVESQYPIRIRAEAGGATMFRVEGSALGFVPIVISNLAASGLHADEGLWMRPTCSGNFTKLDQQGPPSALICLFSSYMHPFCSRQKRGTQIFRRNNVNRFSPTGTSTDAPNAFWQKNFDRATGSYEVVFNVEIFNSTTFAFGTHPDQWTLRQDYRHCVATTCQVESWGNGFCDSTNAELAQNLNLQECGWDGGDCCASTCIKPDGHACPALVVDCQNPSAADFGNSSACFVFSPSSLGDGLCDSGVYNTANCAWDGGDCCDDTCMERPGTSHDCSQDPSTCLDPASAFYYEASLATTTLPVIDDLALSDEMIYIIAGVCGGIVLVVVVVAVVVVRAKRRRSNSSFHERNPFFPRKSHATSMIADVDDYLPATAASTSTSASASATRTGTSTSPPVHI